MKTSSILDPPQKLMPPMNLDEQLEWLLLQMFSFFVPGNVQNNYSLQAGQRDSLSIAFQLHTLFQVFKGALKQLLAAQYSVPEVVFRSGSALFWMLYRINTNLDLKLPYTYIRRTRGKIVQQKCFNETFPISKVKRRPNIRKCLGFYLRQCRSYFF